jgi:VWFA-related protein
MRSLIALAVTLTTLGLATQDPAPAAQPPQTFKSAVDLVPVDVNVIDGSGRPIADLTAQDFSLKVDGKPRRIATAQFIAVTRGGERAPIEPSDYSSNPASAGARLIMLAIDQGNIGASRGKYAIDAARRFIGRLSPDDRVGLVTIPGAGPQIEFTSNHAIVQTLLDSVVGHAPERMGPQRVGLAEAVAFQRNEEITIASVVDRECSDPTVGAKQACQQQLMSDAEQILSFARERTRKFYEKHGYRRVKTQHAYRKAVGAHG